jgi:hypothetical protein
MRFGVVNRPKLQYRNYWITLLQNVNTCRSVNALGGAHMIAFCILEPFRTINVFLCVRGACGLHVQGVLIWFRWVLAWLARGQVAIQTHKGRGGRSYAVWYKEKIKIEDHSLAITV